jgi:hypothetical protein
MRKALTAAVALSVLLLPAAFAPFGTGAAMAGGGGSWNPNSGSPSCQSGWQSGEWGNKCNRCTENECEPNEVSGHSCDYKGDNECCEPNHHYHHFGYDQNGHEHDWWT